MDFFKDSQWIFVDGIPSDVKNGYFCYKDKFIAEKKEKTTVYISAYSQYALYVNGRFVECGQYDGYETYQVFDEVDITPFLVEGENTFEVLQYAVGEDFSTRQKQIAAVIFSVYCGDKLILSSSEGCLSAVISGYTSGEMERVSLQLGYTFKFDSTVPQAVFKKSLISSKQKHLYPRPIKKLIVELNVSGKIIEQGVFYDKSTENMQVGEVMYTAPLEALPYGEVLSETDGGLIWNIVSKRDASGLYLLLDMGGEAVGYISAELEFPKASLRLMAKSLRNDGLLELCSPGKVWVDIPCFTATFMRAVYEYYEYSDDLDFIVEIFDGLTAIAEGFKKDWKATA